MPKLVIIYDSRTGSTKKMARAIAQGAKLVEGVTEVLEFQAKPGMYIPHKQLADADAIILGSPTYYHDISRDMKKFLEEEIAMAKIDLKGKIGAAFGSYGWSGEAPSYLLEIMKNRFGMETIEPSLRIRYAPDEKALEECRKLGKSIAEKIVQAS